jgi:hypothetical protein
MIWVGKSPAPKDYAVRPPKGNGPIIVQKELWMPQEWKKFLSLDFERHYARSFFKLLFLFNPLWILAVSFAFGSRTLDSLLFNWGWNLLEATLVGLFGMGVIKIYLWLEKAWARWSSKSLWHHGNSWFLLFLAFTVPPGLFVALHLMVGIINSFYTGPPIQAQFQWQYYGKEIFDGWLFLLVCFFFKSWQDLKDAAGLSQLRAEELEKERLQALLTKLKDQMNPHFLFNTLNTVASLIPADPVKAESVVVKLSTLFQGVLAATRKTSHSLGKELEFCRDYLEIEQARFGSRLQVKFEMSDGLDLEKVPIPVLLLQPLVENAVKHGLSSRATGGTLWIGAEVKEKQLRVWVDDDGVGFGNSHYTGSGTAMENCRKRLELSYGKNGRMDILNRAEGGTRILLTLPIAAPDNMTKEEK